MAVRSVHVCGTRSTEYRALGATTPATAARAAGSAHGESQPARECVLALCIVKGGLEEGRKLGEGDRGRSVGVAEGEELLDDRR